jgi:hypothetical protein
VGVSLHQLALPQVPELVAYLSHKISAFSASDDTAETTSIDFMPLTRTARDIAPMLFAWWRDALSGSFVHNRKPATCTAADATTIADAVHRIAEKNHAFDAVEAALL